MDDQKPATSSLDLQRREIAAVPAKVASREAGTEDGAIADELGMSVQMVSRYARFADKARSARASRDRRVARGLKAE